MRLLNIYNKLVNKNVDKYRIKWDAKSRSKIQFYVKQFLKPFWFTHIVYEEFPVYGTQLKVDFINFTKKIAIEVQGNQHNSFIPFFHGNRTNYRKSIIRDYDKCEWLKLNKISLIEIFEKEIPSLSESFFKEKYQIELP